MLTKQLITLSKWNLTVNQLEEIHRIGRFLAVGTLGTILDFSLLTLLKLTGSETWVANTISFSAGLINNFFLNRFYTFNRTHHSNWRTQMLKFTLVSVVGLTMNNAIVLFLEAPFGAMFIDPDWGYLPAK